MIQIKNKNTLHWIIGITLNINFLLFNNPAKAFIPKVYVPNQKLLHENLHKPLTQVPDPFEKFNSFGEHNNEML